MKTIVTYLLCLALIAIPFHAPKAQEPPPHDKDVVVLACVIIIIGAVVIYGLLKMCKHIPGPGNGGGTNAPPPAPGTNTNHFAGSYIGKASWVMPRLMMPPRDLHIDPDWQNTVGAFQCSSNLQDWQTILYFTNWLSDTQTVTVAADLHGPVATNWINGPFAPDQEVICDFGNLQALLPQDDRKYYRMVELP